MFEAFAFVIVGLVGGVASLMGTLPSLLVAMFGDTSRLTVSGSKANTPQPTIPGTLIGLPAPADPKATDTIDDVVYKIVKDVSSPTGYVYAFDHIITQSPQSATAAEQTQTSAQTQALQAYAGSPGTVGGVTGAPPAPDNTGTRVFGAGIDPTTGGNQ